MGCITAISTLWTIQIPACCFNWVFKMVSQTKLKAN